MLQLCKTWFQKSSQYLVAVVQVAISKVAITHGRDNASRCTGEPGILSFRIGAQCFNFFKAHLSPKCRGNVMNTIWKTTCTRRILMDELHCRLPTPKKRTVANTWWQLRMMVALPPVVASCLLDVSICGWCGWWVEVVGWGVWQSAFLTIICQISKKSSSQVKSAIIQFSPWPGAQSFFGSFFHLKWLCL